MIFLSGYFGFLSLDMNYFLLAYNGFKFLFLLGGCFFLGVGVQADELFFASPQGDYSGVEVVFKHYWQGGQNVSFYEFFKLNYIVDFVLIKTQYDWHVSSYHFHHVVCWLRMNVPAGKHNVGFICYLISC